MIIDVAGVGYQAFIPVSTFYRLGEEGSEVSLRIHTHVREDALALYGFASAAEHGLFERLIDVAGVGPRLAVNILSGIEADDLVEALRSSDVARLVRIPGVGRKTAERLVVELKDKMPAAATAPASRPRPTGSTPKEDLLSALANLGYSRGGGGEGRGARAARQRQRPLRGPPAPRPPGRVRA